MKVEHGSDGAVWRLDTGAALHLQIGPGARRLEVTEGRLWITVDAVHPFRSRDVWIGAGEAVDLPSGVSLVADAHPIARFRLLVHPQPNLRCRKSLGRVLLRVLSSLSRLATTSVRARPLTP